MLKHSKNSSNKKNINSMLLISIIVKVSLLVARLKLYYIQGLQ